MDSRLIAGAYSQHYRSLEREQEHSERSDSLARARKLSQETNKRRKIQAQKRKLEAKKEEKRRQEILTKRREEQKQATEKYQRSHVSPGSRQNSGRISPQRYTAPCLEDALLLIGRSPRRERPASGRERSLSPKNENDDPLKRSYFTKTRHHSARPSSGRNSHQLNNEARAELMDYSLKNLTSSKSLFEQQLEQQQNLLLQKQQQSLREFSNAVQKEIVSGPNTNDEDYEEVETREMSLSDSCSSLDSLERKGTNNKLQDMQEQKVHIDDKTIHHKNSTLEPQSTFYLNSERQENSLQAQARIPMSHDLTPSAIYQMGNINSNPLLQGLSHESTIDERESANRAVVDHNFKPAVQQNLGDCPEELESSGSSISLIKIPDSGDKKAHPLGGKLLNNNTKSDCHNISPHLSVVGQNAFVRNNQRQFDRPVSGVEGIVQNQHDLRNYDSQSADSRAKISTDASTTVRNEPVMENYNPRYASAIGLSIWPGHSSGNASTALPGPAVSNNMNCDSNNPYGKRSTTVTLASGPTQAAQTKNVQTVALQPQIENNINKNFDLSKNQEQVNFSTITTATSSTPSVINTKPFVPEVGNNDVLTSFKRQDFIYPLTGNYIQNSCSNPQNPNPPLTSVTNTYNNLQQEIEELSYQMLESSRAYTPHAPTPSLGLQHTGVAAVSPFPSHQPEKPQMIHHIPYANELPSGPVPVPAVRTVFPVGKPPVPSAVTSPQNQVGSNEPADKTRAMTVDQTEDNSQNSKQNDSLSNEKEESGDAIEETENTKTIKGILKTLPPKVPVAGQQKGTIQARDSLELAKIQSDKKVKKKSVRFAAFIEENQEEDNTEDLSSTHFAGISGHKQLLNRPTSAKVFSQSKFMSTTKPIRSASAGTTRQPMSLIQNTSALSQNTDKNTKTEHIPPTQVTLSNLPPQSSQPLTTTSPVNRPKAAAHIIMSSDSQHHAAKDGTGSVNTMASTLHKSQLDMKVKAVNNNFMSKVPVKVNTHSNAVVYHVANPTSIGLFPGEQAQQTEVQTQANTERSRIRDNSASKRVLLSNSTVTRTSIVPASTKINYPVSNGTVPSYSNNSNNNGQHISASTNDENKLRLDKTPTDEEISWLWDKVRTCLDKEGEKADAKQGTVPGTDQSARQTPVMSTKIIDGNSLGFNTNGATGLRPGSGYFHTRNGNGATGNAQNKIKPAIHQQGSYLRRYGLLQQRRVSSATGTPSAPTVATQARAGSAGLLRYPGMHNNQASQQQQPAEAPKPLAFSYKPQDEISESTAAFIMAERLAKQSLTDSHIALAMEDAHSKQEAHNNRARLAHPGPGPSALSLEEQKLMESLDKLNERLNATEQKTYTGTIHYHQPYQPHLPGFRGHQSFHSARHQSPPQRGQPRAQSARIRQQIRQYR